MKYRAFVLGGLAAAALSGCGAAPATAPAPSASAAPAAAAQVSTTPAPYVDIAYLFADFTTGKVVLEELPNRLQIRIPTGLTVEEAAPAGWSDTMGAFDAALADAHAAGQLCGYPTVSVELLAADGQILASGFNGCLKFDIYGDHTTDGQQANPPTITLEEFGRIQIGMGLSEVEAIIGGAGVLDSEYGEIGGPVPLTQIYVWQGTADLTSAYIHFEDYAVTIKQQFGLE